MFFVWGGAAAGLGPLDAGRARGAPTGEQSPWMGCAHTLRVCVCVHVRVMDDVQGAVGRVSTSDGDGVMRAALRSVRCCCETLEALREAPVEALCEALRFE